MTTKCRSALISFAASLGLLSGCQTNVPEAGLTLPSPQVLKHPPQYIPPSEQAPLPIETRHLEEAQQKYRDDQSQAAP